MTIYAGEYVRVSAVAQMQVASGVFEDLTDTEVTSATITIWDSASAEVVDDDLAWDVDHEQWIYDWDTTGRTAGSYKTRCMIEGPGSRRTWEYMMIRLATDKAPA